MNILLMIVFKWKVNLLRIYVVKSGDSVWSISQRFGVTPESIIKANQLEKSKVLVVGQSLVIPTREKAYKIMPGDTIWSISKRFGVSVNQILAFNKITNPNGIYPGLIIRIPEQSKNYGVAQVNAFIQPSNPEKEKKVLGESISYLTYVSPFSHHVNADGSLTPLEDNVIVKIAKDNKVASLLSITNLGVNNFDSNVIHSILNNNLLQQTLINNIIALLKRKGYYGVVIDFEKIPPADRDKYNEFLKKVVVALHPNYAVATALAPKVYDVTEGAWHGAHDYKAHGAIVDFVIIMTYEWGWSGGPPMAVAPINEVKKVIDYAVSVIPPKKIMMGMPLYGYDWTLPYTPGAEFAESIGNQEAIDRAGKYGVSIKYDEKSQSPYYNYMDEKGNKHIVWFEDARSVFAKFKLVNEYGLRGVSYWALGKPFPQNWQVLDDTFIIAKV